MFILRFVWLVLNITAALAWWLASLSLWINPAFWTFPSILALGYEWLLLLNLLLALPWLMTKHKSYALLFVIGLLITLPATRNTFSFSSASASADANKSLKVMTYNTLCLGKERDKDQTKILRFIREQDADVVCLQEIRTSKRDRQYYLTLNAVKQQLGYEYSYIDYKNYQGEHSYGMAVFSRYPLINKQTIRYESYFNQSDRCDIVVGSDTIRLINNHLESNQLTAADLTIPHLQSEQLRQSADHITHKLTAAYPVRVSQARIVRGEIDQSPYPVLVCGDFNDVPVSYTYRTVSRSLHDAFLETTRFSGGHTFTKRQLGIRIDFILYSDRFDAVSCDVLDAPYSDHLPVVATLVW